jgi:Na+-transporting NADH:ubiquinone oxidoreductase subunit NqrB
MELIIGTVVIVAVLLALAVVRVNHIASWRSVAKLAASTGSLRSCVEFIRYCELLESNDHV